MPLCWSSAPRKKLPPPTTTATWVPDLATCAICVASPCTTTGSTPTLPPPNTSPESLSITRAYGLVMGVSSVVPVRSATWPRARRPTLRGRGRRTQGPCHGSGAGSLEADEPLDLDARSLELLADRGLAVGDRRLVEQSDVLEVGVHPALDDARQSLLGLALLLGLGLGDAPLVLDEVGGHLVPAQVGRAHGRDLHRDRAGRGLVGAVVLDQHAHLGRQ